MAASEKDIALAIISKLMDINRQLRAESGKKQRQTGAVDNTGVLEQKSAQALDNLRELEQKRAQALDNLRELEQKRAQALKNLLEIVSRDKDAYKKALEELDKNCLGNFHLFLKGVKNDCPFITKDFLDITKEAVSARAKEAAARAAQPKARSQKQLAKKAQKAKEKETIVSPKNIVFKFLQTNHIVQVTLGEEEFAIEPQNESSISSAINMIIQYFGLNNMKKARNINLLLNLLDPECRKKDEELIEFLLFAGKKGNSLVFSYLVCFEQPEKTGQFTLKANFDKAMLYRFYHIIFHAIIYSIITNYTINIDNSIIELLRKIFFSLDKNLADAPNKKAVVKSFMYGSSSQDDFSPEQVYALAQDEKPIGQLLLKEGIYLEAKEALIDAKVLAKQVIAFMNSQEEAIIILGVPEEKEAHGDGRLRPNLATGFSFEECRAKIEELKEYISKNIGIINSGQKFSFEEAVSAVIVPLKNIRQEEDAATMEDKYCLLLMVRGQDYLSYLRLDSAPGSQSQAIAVYMRDYCNGTIESAPAHDNKILTYFLYKEFLAKDRKSPEIKVLSKANKLFGYFAKSFVDHRDEQFAKKAISIYYLAKMHYQMFVDCKVTNAFMLYENLLRLLEEVQKEIHAEDKVGALLSQLHFEIAHYALPNLPILASLKEALRQASYIPPKVKEAMAEGDSDMRSAPSGADDSMSTAIRTQLSK